MNADQLKIDYPAIAKGSLCFKLQQIQTGLKELQGGANNITDEFEN
jgi:hypothetical protein